MQYLSAEPTEQEVNAYVEFWRGRARKVVKIMDWQHCIGFHPDFAFARKNNSVVHLPLDVVDKLIELNETIK